MKYYNSLKGNIDELKEKIGTVLENHRQMCDLVEVMNNLICCNQHSAVNYVHDCNKNWCYEGMKKEYIKLLKEECKRLKNEKQVDHIKS